MSMHGSLKKKKPITAAKTQLHQIRASERKKANKIAYMKFLAGEAKKLGITVRELIHKKIQDSIFYKGGSLRVFRSPSRFSALWGD